VSFVFKVRSPYEFGYRHVSGTTDSLLLTFQVNGELDSAIRRTDAGARSYDPLER